jgi:hypothetical protein
MGQTPCVACGATNVEHGAIGRGNRTAARSHSTRSANRPTDSAGATYTGPSFGPSEKGYYTLWLVGFSGKAWVPVALIGADSWYDARAKGERLYPWIERGRLEASSGNRLSLFEQNAAESLARYAEKRRRLSTTSLSSLNQPHHQTPIPIASSGSKCQLGGGLSTGLREVLRRSGVHVA